MSRHAFAKDNAPTIPAETCPIIDRVSMSLDAIAGDLETFREGLAYNRRKTVDNADVLETLLDAEANLAGLRLKLEELRNANDQLRESGRYWRGVAKGANDMLDGVVSFLSGRAGGLSPDLVDLVKRIRGAA